MGVANLLNGFATVYVPLGEDSNGAMRWQRYELARVYCESSKTDIRSSGGKHPSDRTTLYVFDARSTVKVKGVVHSAEAKCPDIFDIKMTRIAGGFLQMVPYRSDAQTPPADSVEIQKVQHFKAGTRRMWHWEVVAE